MSKVIIVTGAASGLGLEICKALNGLRGIEVVGVDIDGGQYVNYHSDVGDSNEVCKFASDLLSDMPSQDELFGIINCAGINCNEWFADICAESLMRVMGVNAFSMVHMVQPFLKQLQASEGFVLNIVSNAAHMPMTSSLAYNASKAAALMITKQMAHELTKTHGITVFSVSPNKIAGTGMSKQIEDNVVKTRGWTKEYAAEYQRKSLMHGLESPPEGIAQLIAELITSGNWKYMSGCDIPFGK